MMRVLNCSGPLQSANVFLPTGLGFPLRNRRTFLFFFFFSYAGCPAIRDADNKREEEEPPGLRIHERLDELSAVPHLGLRGSLELLGPQGCRLTLDGGQKLGRVWRVGQQKPDDGRPGDGDETEQNEEQLEADPSESAAEKGTCTAWGTYLPLGERALVMQDAVGDHGADDAGRGIAGEPERMA
jgi:hypothetical protein